MNVRYCLTSSSRTSPIPDSATEVTMAAIGVCVRGLTFESAAGTRPSKAQAKMSLENPTMMRNVIAIGQVIHDTAMTAFRTELPESRLAKNGTNGGTASG